MSEVLFLLFILINSFAMIALVGSTGNVVVDIICKVAAILILVFDVYIAWEIEQTMRKK